jgi:hypothetical protein
MSELARIESRRSARAAAVLAFCAVASCAIASCKGNSSSNFPAGLEPLDPTNQAPAPAGTPTDPHPEAVESVTGETDDYVWAHAHGYVHASLEQTWEAMRDPAVCVDRRKVDQWDVTQDDEPSYKYSYLIHDLVHSIVTVEFFVGWRHDVFEGTADAPTAVAARFQKVYGTDYIEAMSGSILARKIDDTTTELELIEHLKAHAQGPGTAESTMKDYFASVVARVHGQPLPTY